MLNRQLARHNDDSDKELDFIQQLFAKEEWIDALRKLALMRCMPDRAQKDEMQIVDFLDKYDQLNYEVALLAADDALQPAEDLDSTFARCAFDDPHKSPLK